MSPAVATLVLLAALLNARPEHATSFLALESAAGDPIGQGTRVVLSSEDGTFSGMANPPGSPASPEAYLGRVYLSFYCTQASCEGERWELMLAPPAGAALAVGSYEHARRTEPRSSGQPLLRIRHNGMPPCCDTTGRFQVLESAYRAGRLERFAARFEVRCAGRPDGVTGTIRYRAPEQHTRRDQPATFRAISSPLPIGTLTANN